MAHSVVEGGNGTDSDADFHQTLAEASGNPFLRDFMRFLNGKLRGLIQRARTHFSQQPSLPMMVQEEHVAIFEAILEKGSRKGQGSDLGSHKKCCQAAWTYFIRLGMSTVQDSKKMLYY